MDFCVQAISVETAVAAEVQCSDESMLIGWSMPDTAHNTPSSFFHLIS